MPKREDEYYLQNYYGGHPPACTCVRCNEKRLAGLASNYLREKYFQFGLAGISGAGAVWMLWLMAARSLDFYAGITLAALNLSVMIWALRASGNPWSTFRSAVIGLAIVLAVIIVSLASW